MLNRRSLVSIAGVLLTGSLTATAAPEKKEEDVSPPEDLMREHGLLNRILLIYDYAQQELVANKSFPLNTLHDAAGTIQSFIENYHEKLEEQHIFPRFEKAGKLVDLVKVLKAQHEAGRKLTNQILQLAATKQIAQSDRQKLVDCLHEFLRMYRPHEAREDTVLFPAFRSIVSKHEFDALGEEFEDKEHQLFGKEGFEGVVAKVAEIEKKLGIYDLAQFTPKKL